MTKFPNLEVPAYLLAALTSSSGVVGYILTGQLHSVFAGTAIAALCKSHLTDTIISVSGPLTRKFTDGLSGYRIQKRQPYGIELALLTSAILGGPTIPRAIRLRRITPIFLSTLSISGFIIFGGAYQRRLKD